jgi:hypothetical protein
MSSPGNSASPTLTSSSITATSSPFTTLFQNNLPAFPHHLLALHLQQPPPRPPYVTPNQRTPAPRYESQRPLMNNQPHSIHPPSLFSGQRMRGTRIFAHPPVSPVFLSPGMGKITRCLGSTPYREYLSNFFLSHLGPFFTLLIWTLFFRRGEPLRTVPCALVFASHPCFSPSRLYQ